MMAQDAANTIMDTADIITLELDTLVEESESNTREALASLALKINEINMASRYQDITSQHLHQASQIVEAIQTRMQKLFRALQDIGEKNGAIRSIVENHANEADAEDEIDTADSIYRENAISQDKIDALFGN